MGLLCVNFAWSQTESDLEAVNILKQLQAKYKAYKNFKAGFTFTLENLVDSIKEDQKGTLHLMGSKYKLELSGQQVISDSKTVWTYLPEANEVTISTVEPGEEGLSPEKIFHFYEEGMLCRLQKDEKLNGKTVQVIDMTPTKGDRSYFRVMLWVDKTDRQIMRSRIFEKAGNRYTYEINNFEPNLNLTDSFFAFETAKHPGVEVVDLR